MELDPWIARIRDRNSMTFEDAYWGERPTGPDVVPRLIAELHLSNDGYTRGKFAELLGESGDISVVPMLIAELSHSEPAARLWAVLALEQLGMPEGVEAAKHYRNAHPEDFIQ
jgi:HEAT repeat protein